MLLGKLVRVSRPLLYALAYVWRRMLFRTTFIAVTGSHGKTTAKEMLADILGSRSPTYRTWRNQNGKGLVVLNILRVRPWHRYAVLEVGVGVPGAMAALSRLVAPDIAVLLPVRPMHTRQFRDLDEHAAEKEVLLSGLREGGVAILNADDVRVRAMAQRTSRRVVLVGESQAADLRVTDASSAWPRRLTFTAHRGGQTQRIETQLVGSHWLPSAGAAVAAACEAGMTLPEIARSTREARPFNARMEPVRLPSGAVVLRDDYAASAEAVVQSLAALENATARRRMFIWGDISDFEGTRRKKFDFLAPRILRAAEVFVMVNKDGPYWVKRMVEAGIDPANAHSFADCRDAADFLKKEFRDGDLALMTSRNADHISRLLLAQFGQIRCWKTRCGKNLLCDICWELGLPNRELTQIRTLKFDYDSTPAPVSAPADS